MLYDIIVIGGGSAGMAGAISAYDAGAKNILIIEKDKYLGGILLQCIHNGFGLHTFKEELTGPVYASKVESILRDKDIEIATSSFVKSIELENDLKVVTYSNASGMHKVKAKALIMATGCYERTRGAIQIPGDRPSGVMTAGLAQKYINIEGYMVGRKVVILGSGDIGLIMARRLTLEGAKVLGVFELMPYSNGLNRNIVQCLEDYKIPLYLSTTVKEIIGKERLEKVVVAKVDDKFNFIEGTEVTYDVDTLLLSVGLIPSNDLLEPLGVVINPKTKGPVVNEYLETSIKGIFACGNSLHVHDLVDFAYNEGVQAGLSAASYLNNLLTNSNVINIIPDTTIGYTMPSYLYKESSSFHSISFRVRKPYKKSVIEVYQNDILIKSIKKNYLLPAEMVTIKLDDNIITSNNNIRIGVKDE